MTIGIKNKKKKKELRLSYVLNFNRFILSYTKNDICERTFSFRHFRGTAAVPEIILV
jgi:hypothetical protein